MIQTTRFKYFSLKELNKGDYNFYAIIYDASLPSQDKIPNHYICTVKVIDKDINRLNNPDNLQDEIISVVIKSNSKDNLPYIHKFGDIIRIQRGKLTYNKNKKVIYLNLTSMQSIKSTWAIFPNLCKDSTHKYKPVSSLIANPILENLDKQKIDVLREWSANHFKEKHSIGFLKETKLNNRAKVGQNIDTMVKIVGKNELDSSILFYVQDETDKCRLSLPKYFNFIEVSDLVRVRGVFVQEDVLQSYASTNVLVIPKQTYTYADYDYRLYINQKEFMLGKKKEETHYSISNTSDLKVDIDDLEGLITTFRDFKDKNIDYEPFLIKSKNMKKIIKIEYLPEFNIKKVDSITDLKKICDSLKEEIKQIPESKFLILDNNYLALREELLNNQVTKKTEKVLIDCFITHIEPTNIEEGIRKGCRRMSCLIEDFSQKNYICKQCNFEASYFYNYDLYLQFHPQSFDIIKVNLNTLRELEGDGLISIDPNIAKRDIKTLKEKMFDLINSQTITTLCIELPTWKVLGKYSLV